MLLNYILHFSKTKIGCGVVHLSLVFILRYGYHISKNSYFICHDQDVIRSLFERLRNYGGQKDSYPTKCGRFSISAVRDLTTGYDNNQPDKKAVRMYRLVYTLTEHSLPLTVNVPLIFCFNSSCPCIARSSRPQVLPTSSSSQMITFTFSNGGVATMRTSGTEPKIKYYTELCAAPGNRYVTTEIRPFSHSDNSL